MRKRQGTLDRFFSKVRLATEDECWPWLAGCSKDGYGSFGIHRVTGDYTVRAHRFSWMIHHAEEIPPGMGVLHHCDNPLCVNPGHLFLGTNFDNAQDRESKNRTCRGEALPQAKLTEADVYAIRKDMRTHAVIASAFRVSGALICLIKTHKRWAHV